MGLPKFTRPKGGDSQLSPNLYVANCGPSVGLSYDVITLAFSKYGAVKGVYPADESGTRVIVSYYDETCAQAALRALDRCPCPDLGGRSLHIQYSVHLPHSRVKTDDSVQVSLEASELKIPGIYLMHDFLSPKQEEDLLAAVDARPWQSLAKRRVQHYGYEFCYETRNVNTKEHLGELPLYICTILERLSSFKKLDNSADVIVDQLTTVVCYYFAKGERVSGWSWLVTTYRHSSAFEGSIFSLSLAGPCIMEFRKYPEGDTLLKPTSTDDREDEKSQNSSSFVRKAVYLPPRSMLLFLGEARYAWHHYIPHHKDSIIKRSSRRVSFTFRKVRKGPCKCEYPYFCDSQR